MDEQPTAGDMIDLLRKTRGVRGRSRARQPKRIGDVTAQLFARRGYGQVQSAADLQQAWNTEVGEAAGKYSRVGRFNRGVLEIIVGNSVWLQELTFRKQQLLEGLRQKLPDTNIRDLRLRSGTL